MVWPFSSSSNDTSSSSDPYSKLDPALRQFLDRESTPKHNPPQAQPFTPPQPTPEPILDPPPQSHEPVSPVQSTPTLFPDGRYAHLWKTYRPQSSIAAEHKSDQERLSDVLSAWKDRNATISKAAMENCAAAEEELDRCWRNPSVGQRFTMCRTEQRALDRCITMNQRFLKTLGYLSSLDRTPQEQEAVQMHADRLYARMLEREREMELARKEGRQIGDGLMGGGESPVRPPELENLTEHGKKQLEERLKGLNPMERDLEERAFAAEIRAGAETMEQIEKYRSEARQARTDRIESGKTRPSDRLQSWLGW